MAEDKRTSTKTMALAAGAICVIVGGLGAYSVASEPIAYIASMSNGIIVLFLLLPSVLVLFCLGIAGLALQKMRFAAAALVSCVVLPGSYFGVLKSAEALGLAQYKDNPINEMRPLGEEPNGNVIVIYTKESSFEQQEKLSNEVIHPWKEGPGFTGETGVRASIGLLDIDGRTVQKILFDASATESKKEKLRMGLDASPIVYRYFENLSEAEVRARLEATNTNNKL